jgi:hypothetical protein
MFNDETTKVYQSSLYYDGSTNFLVSGKPYLTLGSDCGYAVVTPTTTEQDKNTIHIIKKVLIEAAVT